MDNAINLVAGEVYDIGSLEFLGWRTLMGFQPGHVDGWNCWARFLSDGTYLGPSPDGVTPVFGVVSE